MLRDFVDPQYCLSAQDLGSVCLYCEQAAEPPLYMAQWVGRYHLNWVKIVEPLASSIGPKTLSKA